MMCHVCGYFNEDYGVTLNYFFIVVHVCNLDK
jgi:hypothetical protein